MSTTFTRRALLAGAAGGAAVVGYVAATHGSDHTPHVGDPLVGRRVGTVPVDDPGADAWGGEGQTVVALAAQNLAPPNLATATVPEVRVSALHDGTMLGVRLSWVRAEAAELSGVARFADAAAVLLPAGAPRTPAITMGAAGAPVHIVQWRASWQRDVDLGASQGVTAQFPDVIRDLDPSDLFPADVAVLWNPGRALGNPMSALERTTPLEELVAEGFGTTTALPDQKAAGRGIHQKNEWHVVIAIPLDRGRGMSAIAPGATWPLAVAVWDGSAGNRGGRKHYGGFVGMRLEA